MTKTGPKPLPTTWTKEAYHAAYVRMTTTGQAIGQVKKLRDELRAVEAHHAADYLQRALKSVQGAHNHALRRFMHLRELATPEQLHALGERKRA